MAVRLVDIAADLQLSVSTVSKALAESREISAPTIRRVRARALELGYTPNAAARRLRTGRTMALGLLCHDSIGWQSLPVLLGAEDAAGALGVSVLLADCRGDAMRAAHHLKTMREHGIDGIIALAGDTNDRPSLGNVGIPVVYAYGASALSEDCSVVPDEEDGARQAVQLLVNLGRRSIGHITGPTSYMAAQRRSEQAHQVLAGSGLSMIGEETLFGEWTEAWGRTATDILLRRGTLDAVFCGSDAIARGVYEALFRRGLSVPEDVAVVGFDNWDAVTLNIAPALTSVDMQLRQVGEASVAALFRAMRGVDVAGVTKVPCKLMVRSSTA